MSFPCSEILRCIEEDGLSIGRENDELPPFTPNNAIKAGSTGVVAGGATGFFTAGLTTLPAAGTAGAAGFVGGLVVDIGEWVIPRLAQLLPEDDFDYGSYASSMDHILENEGISRPRIESPQLRGEIYEMAWLYSSGDARSIGENLDVFTRILQTYGQPPYGESLEGDALSLTLATSPFLYPLMLESENQVGEDEDSLNDIIFEDITLIEDFAASPLTANMIAEMLSSPGIQEVIAGQLFTISSDGEGDSLFNQSVQAAVEAALVEATTGQVGEDGRLEAANSLQQMRTDINLLQTQVDGLQMTVNVDEIASKAAALVECSCNDDTSAEDDCNSPAGLSGDIPGCP